MKKNNEIKRRSNRLKEFKDFRLIVYAKNMSVFITVIFLIYIGLQIGNYKGDVHRLFTEVPTNVIGFIASVANLYIWFELNNIIQDIKLSKNIETIRLKLMIMIVGEVILFNFVTVGLLVLSLIKYFKWKDVKITDLIKDIKREGQKSSIISLTLTLLICILLTYTIIAAIR
ncbi:hypothetical protein [Clostridium amazonitimonense]|uniref:hypothetical protein n=1 Tax=Clostridium amazonitimonense TaxID=1499689 RepID=UPI0005095024|nr:hypothetical protein [Clostridium amazonitimonense]